MNITVILKPAPHCPIPYGHSCHRGYVPAEDTDITQTWHKHAQYGDDYDLVERTAHLDMMGDFAK
jgi:hypothetical protein